MKIQQLRQMIKESVRSVLSEGVSDPSKKEMLHFLQQQFGGEEGFEDNAEVAIYWFANHYHGGQWSNLYSVLSTSPFRPGSISRGPEPDSMEDMMYQALEAKFGGKQTGQESELQEVYWDDEESYKRSHGDFADQEEYEIPCPKCGETKTHIDNPSNPTIYTCSKCNHRWNPNNKEQNKGWSVVAVGYPGIGKGSPSKWAVHKDYSTEYLTKTGEWGKPMFSATFWNRNDAEAFARKMLGNSPVKEVKNQLPTWTSRRKGETGPPAVRSPLPLTPGSKSGNKSGSNTRILPPKLKETSEHSDFIQGQSNNTAASRVNKLLSALSKGLFSDDSWQPINKIFSKLGEAGINVSLVSAKYGGHEQTENGMPKYKEWNIIIPFTNNRGRPMELVGQITAHGAGSVENPLDRYDITAYVTAVPKKIQEEEQPEPYDQQTDTFAPGPRQRPEDWQHGGESGFLSQENVEGYVLDWIIEKLNVETDPKKREALQIVHDMV